MTTFRAERVVSPTEGSVAWVVIDGDYGLHAEGCAFLAGLRGRDRSINTERLYAGRVALFLSWCAAEGADWKAVHLGQMVRFKQWLVTEPLPRRRRTGGGAARLRSAVTADAILGTVCEFFRFCAQHDLVSADVVRRLHEPRYLRFLPPGYEAGEDDQFRTVRSSRPISRSPARKSNACAGNETSSNSSCGTPSEPSWTTSPKPTSSPASRNSPAPIPASPRPPRASKPRTKPCTLASLNSKTISPPRGQVCAA